MGKVPEAAIAAVVGHPVAHSLSPAIFSFLSRELKRPVVYRRLDLAPEELSRFFRAVADKDLFTGWNVTIPHKETTLKLMSELSPGAAAVGAVNVVRFAGKGTKGYNTDVMGIAATLEEQGLGLRGRSALLYGAGGAAKAVAFALGEAGARRVSVWNRTHGRARTLCRRFGALFRKSEFVPIRTVDGLPEAPALLVNATSVGLGGNAGRLALPRELAPRALAFDLIYRPAVTPFLKESKKRGLRTVNGLDMLLWQALATWEIWFGKLPEPRRTKQRLKSFLLEVV